MTSLDELVDQALLHDPAAADWSAATQQLNVRLTEGHGAFDRLFRAPFGQRLYTVVRNEVETLGHVGNLAASFLDRREMESAVSKTVGHRLSADAKRIVVYHGEHRARRSILILDPSMDMAEPPRVVPGELISGIVHDAMRADDALASATRADAIEALWVARPRIVIAPQPSMEYVCVVRPPGRVECGGQTSRPGAYVRDRVGRFGVTVCFHGTGAVGTEVRIDGTKRMVTAASQLLDTCFVELDPGDRPQGPWLADRGALNDRAPGAQEAHSFWSGAEQEQVARIVGADLGVPAAIRGRQLCVHTDPVLNTGDSGGALINKSEQLVGFAFQKTPFGSPVQFATWVWAHGALEELGLVPA